MSIYVYELLDPVTQTVLYAGASQRPSELYQEHLDCECAETAALVQGLLAQGRLPVMKIISSHDTWNAAHETQGRIMDEKNPPLPAAPFHTTAHAQQGFASFM